MEPLVALEYGRPTYLLTIYIINLYCHHSLSLLAGLRDSIWCPIRADLCKILLVGQYWYVHAYVSIRESRLWVFPYFTSSTQRVLLVLLE